MKWHPDDERDDLLYDNQVAAEYAGVRVDMTLEGPVTEPELVDRDEFLAHDPDGDVDALRLFVDRHVEEFREAAYRRAELEAEWARDGAAGV